MSMTAADITAFKAEIANDPLALGYAGKTASEIQAIINAPGSASSSNRVLVVSETPIFVSKMKIVEIVTTRDGLSGELTGDTAIGMAALTDWIQTDTHDAAKLVRFTFNLPDPSIDLASATTRSIIDMIGGISPAGANGKLCISEAAHDDLMNAGMVLMSRAQEIHGQNYSLSDINVGLA